MTETHKFLVFFAAWIGSIAAVGYWIVWKIKRDDR